MKPITVESLLRRKPVLVADLLGKVETEDWHGVADAAMDLRDLEAQLEVLESLEPRVDLRSQS